MSTHYDIAVLGSGPGGYVAALKAAQLGAQVAIIEKSHLGGTCLNNGCIPSKTLLASAHLAHHLQHAAELGVDVAGPISIRWDAIQARKNKILQTLRAGIKGLLTARKVTIHTGRGQVTGPGQLRVERDQSAPVAITADKIILAVGSTPARIPGWPSDPSTVCTSDEALHWSSLPKSLLIVGGGVIGCEFACMLAPLGVSVTMVEMMPQLLPAADPEIAETLAKIFRQRGIAIHTGVKIEQLASGPAGMRATLAGGTTIEAERVLVATGRRAATEGIGLESLGLTTERGFVRVNDRMETAVRGVYCIGDANGRALLAHAASAQGTCAAENALGHEHELNAPIPGAVYTFPEVGSVGWTAEEARSRDVPIALGKFPLGFLGKAMAVNETEGFVKVIRHREEGTLLGVHMIGHNVTECIAAAGALLHQKARVRDVAETVFAHPTISEALKEAAEDSLAEGLHLPPRKIMRVMAAV